MVKYVMFDMDGTLLNDKSELTAENISMVRKLQKRGIKVGVATGRPWYMIQKETRLLELQLPIISGNGALITSKGHKREEVLLNSDHWKSLVDDFFKEDISFFLHTNEAIFYSAVGDGEEFTLWLRGLLDLAEPNEGWEMADVNSLPDWRMLKPFKIVVWVAKAKMDKLAKKIEKKYSSFGCVQSGEKMLEVNEKSVSKGAALVRLAKEGYLDLKETMVFGDSHNDLSMFQAAGHAVAMANAADELKKAADEVCPFDNNQGVWQYWQDKAEFK